MTGEYIELYDNWLKLIETANITYGELILMCAIHRIIEESGDCLATNDYFSSLMHMSKRNVSTYINRLKSSGLIFTRTTRFRDGNARRITIRYDNVEALIK